MKLRYSKTLIAAALTTALVGCGGGNQSAGDAVEEGAAEVAGAASDAVDSGGAALEEGAAEVAGAADAATDEAGAMVDEATEEVAAAADEAAEEVAAVADEAAEGADDLAAGAEGGWTDLQANWEDSVEGIQAKWGELSAEELMSTGGDREQLVALIQEKYNLGAEEAEQQVSDWEATM